jgi:hypothetical protein
MIKNILTRIALVIPLLLLLNGCAGLAVGTFGTHEAFASQFQLKAERNEFEYVGSEKYTKEEVIELWGEPDRKEVDGDYHTLMYYDGRAWSGVGAFVVILPIPLVLPTDRLEQTFYFKENTSVGVVRQYGEIKNVYGYMCGSNECSFVAGRADNGYFKGEIDWADYITNQL